jgi:hypothetical protein
MKFVRYDLTKACADVGLEVVGGWRWHNSPAFQWATSHTSYQSVGILKYSVADCSDFHLYLYFFCAT